MKFRLGLSGEPIDSTIDDRLDGVGQSRTEYLCREREESIALDSCRQYISEYVSNVCAHFKGRDVWYKFLDILAVEANSLQGVEEVIEEKWSHYGLRGLRRAGRFPDTFRKEVEMVAALACRHDNLKILLPYAWDVKEVEVTLGVISSIGLNVPFGIKAETPSSILQLEQFMDLGVSNVTLGVETLTALVLGTYRFSQFYDPSHPAVLKMLEQAVAVCEKYGVNVSAIAYARPEFIRRLEDLGIVYYIIHYEDVPKVLDIAAARLPEIGRMRRTKALTKKRREEREREFWRKALSG